MGTPFRFNDINREKYLGCLRQGMRRGAAAKAAGISRQQVLAYQRQHPEFLRECQQAEADACDVVEEALWRKAVDGNMTAIVFWLLNRSEGRWQDKRAVSQVNVNVPTQDTEAELLLRLAELKRMEEGVKQRLSPDSHQER